MALTAFDFGKWIDEHAHLAPVGNQMVFREAEDLIIQVVAARRAHRLPRRPLRGVLLPAARRHRAQGDRGRTAARHPDPRGRDPPDTRASATLAAAAPARLGQAWWWRRSGRATSTTLSWYCPNCWTLIHRVTVNVQNIVKDLPPLFDAFSQRPALPKLRPYPQIGGATEAAAWLLAQHENRSRFQPLPPLSRTPAEAYAIQEAFGPRCAPNSAAQRSLAEAPPCAASCASTRRRPA